jgi:AcrR family transcriptional regulator
MGGRRDEILDAALAIADERGLEAVSMRAVAERVGVTPMALYPHIGGKPALLDAMVRRLLAQLPAAVEPVGGRPYLRDFAHVTRKLIQQHPWAATLLFARPATTADGVATVDHVYPALLDLGVPAAETARLERLLSTFVIGYAASEAGGRFEGHNPRGMRGRDLPAHTRLRPWLAQEVDWDAEFEADLDDLERLIQAVVTRGSAVPGTLGEPKDAQT